MKFKKSKNAAKSKKLLFNLLSWSSFLIIGIALGIYLTTHPRTNFLIGSFSNVPIDDSPTKIQQLETFYRDYTEALSRGDFEAIYSHLNPSDTEWLSLEDMKIIYNDGMPASSEYIIHNLSVNEDVGSIDRTIIKCLTTECKGEDREEKRDTKEYEYINGQWYLPANQKPSEKARQLAAFMYVNSSPNKKKELADKYAGGIEDSSLIIKIWSMILENDQDLMAYDEALVEKYKAESSKSNVYVEAPTTIQKTTPLIQPQTYPRNCTSNTIGSYTYTNCY